MASANIKDGLVAVLLEHGANPDSLDEKGNTAMHWASSRGVLNIVIRLCNKEASTTLANNQGATALHKACSFGQVPPTHTH
jgi:26S proteasome non-ATPase regulatory subunit 10